MASIADILPHLSNTDPFSAFASQKHHPFCYLPIPCKAQFRSNDHFSIFPHTAQQSLAELLCTTASAAFVSIWQTFYADNLKSGKPYLTV